MLAVLLAGKSSILGERMFRKLDAFCTIILKAFFGEHLRCHNMLPGDAAYTLIY